MAEEQWYYYRNDERQGPVSFEELKELAEAGTLGPDDLISRPGMPEWIPARDQEGLFSADTILPPPPATKKGSGLGERLRRLGNAADLIDSLPHLRFVRSILGRLRDWISQERLDALDRWSKAAGSVALLVAAALLLLAFLILGIRSKSVVLVLVGLVGIPLVTVLVHFIGAVFMDAGGSLLRESPSNLSSAAFLTCFALASFLGAVLAILAGVASAIGGSWMALLGGLGGAVVLVYAGGLALSPASIHVDVGGNASAGEEAIGILMFLFKLPLRLVPFVFGVGLLVGVIASVVLLWQSIAAEPFVGQMASMPVASGVFGLALFPFAAYLLFLLLYLQVDLLRAVLVIPRKLDGARGRADGEAPGDRGPRRGLGV